MARKTQNHNIIQHRLWSFQQYKNLSAKQSLQRDACQQKEINHFTQMSDQLEELRFHTWPEFDTPRDVLGKENKEQFNKLHFRYMSVSASQGAMQQTPSISIHPGILNNTNNKHKTNQIQYSEETARKTQNHNIIQHRLWSSQQYKNLSAKQSLQRDACQQKEINHQNT